MNNTETQYTEQDILDALDVAIKASNDAIARAQAEGTEADIEALEITRRKWAMAQHTIDTETADERKQEAVAFVGKKLEREGLL